MAGKRFFGSEVSKDPIISFLNEVIQQEVIVDITFRNVEMLRFETRSAAGCSSISSVRMKRRNIHSRRCRKAGRNIFPTGRWDYASFAIQQQSMIVKEKLEKEPDEVIRKRWNYQISKVYVVCILSYIMDLSARRISLGCRAHGPGAEASLQ